MSRASSPPGQGTNDAGKPASRNHHPTTGQPTLHCRKRETEAEEDFSGSQSPLGLEDGGSSWDLGRPCCRCGQEARAQARALTQGSRGRGEEKVRAGRKQAHWGSQLPRLV